MGSSFLPPFLSSFLTSATGASELAPAATATAEDNLGKPSAINCSGFFPLTASKTNLTTAGFGLTLAEAKTSLMFFSSIYYKQIYKVKFKTSF